MHEIIADKKVIFFDMGNTIDYPASGDWWFTNRFNEVAGERVEKCSPEDIHQALEAGVDYLDKNHLIGPENAEEEEYKQLSAFYTIISDRLDLKMTETEIADVARDRAFNMDNYLLFPDAKKVLQTLHKTHRLGIISDTWPSIDLQLRKFDIKQYFSFTTFSFELGVFKPDRRMYMDALGKCGCDASETVFIDDGPRNLDGAAACGITPILISAVPGRDFESQYTKIRSLSELL